MPEGMSGSASGGQLEERVDLSEETTVKIKQAKELVASSGSSSLKEALDLLGALEKKCRVGNDTASLVRVCETSLELCGVQCRDWEALIVTLQTLCGRRSQKSRAISAMIQKAMPWVLAPEDGADADAVGYTPLPTTTPEDKTNQEKLVVALRDLTDGKIFLEAERARLTRALAILKEADGDSAAAADILQEVHIETYGSLSKREKMEFILEQMRLTLLKKDYVRAHIVSGKINRNHLAEEKELKIKFYTLMTQYHRHERNAFELAKDYHAIYSTPNLDDKSSLEALENATLFLVLSPFDNEQQDMMNRIHIDSNLEKLPACQNTLKLLLRKEIITFPLPHQADLERLESFHLDDLTSHWTTMLRKRIIQHNIRVTALYYQRIRGVRLAELLGITPTEVETELAEMVSNGDVYAKIDRPQDIIRFASHQSPEETLTAWSADIASLLHLVETTTHMIQKENMTQQ